MKSLFRSFNFRKISLKVCRHHGTNTFHKRELPSSLVALSSAGGKDIFKQALASGQMESFFPLSEQFITQSEPSFCALTSLAMVLNALKHDPKRTWKGVWRWITEETLQCEFPDVCGHSIDKVKISGMNFVEFKSLARCHNVTISSFGVRQDSDKKTTVDEFRAQVIESTSCSRAESFMICNFSRKHLGQTGDGHFSPIGGYNRDLDLVLIMDTARFKYPPFWVSLQTLYESMEVIDKATGGPRGYFVVCVCHSKKSNGQGQSDGIGCGTSSSQSSCGHSYDYSDSHNHSYHSHSHTHDHNH
jgi:glutathione gamma-glutamylcysteinyltransferase